MDAAEGEEGKAVTPSDALESTVLAAMSDRLRWLYRQPGVVVQSMPKETREALSRLTSEHTLAMRWHDVDGPEEQARKADSKLNMEFDKKAKVRK